MESGYIDARHARVDMKFKPEAKDVLIVERDEQPVGVVAHGLGPVR